jgi:effector-binding domain-containing protein
VVLVLAEVCRHVAIARHHDVYGCRTYLWFDDKGKKTRVAAPQYIDYVMTFTQKTISDESIFPTKYGKYMSSLFSEGLLSQFMLFFCASFVCSKFIS